MKSKKYAQPWVSAKVAKRTSTVSGVGLFALEPIKKDEVIAVKGGYKLNGDQFAKLSELCKSACLQVGDSDYIGPMFDEEAEQVMVGINHSCVPNVGLNTDYDTVAMRDIKAGEELTSDYCLAYSNDFFEFSCTCKTKDCRKTITGRDWQQRDLIEKYLPYYAPYLRERVSRLSIHSEPPAKVL